MSFEGIQQQEVSWIFQAAEGSGYQNSLVLMREWVKQAWGESGIKENTYEQWEVTWGESHLLPPLQRFGNLSISVNNCGLLFWEVKTQVFPFSSLQCHRSPAASHSSFGHGDVKFPSTLPKEWNFFLTYLMNLFRVHLRTYQGVRNSQSELRKVVGPHSLYLFFIIFWTLSMHRVIASLLQQLGETFEDIKLQYSWLRQISIPVTGNLEHLTCDFVPVHPMHLCFKPNEINS